PSVQLFLLIAIGKFASNPHDLVTTGPLAPPPPTGINNQTLPREILNCLLDFIEFVSLISSKIRGRGSEVGRHIISFWHVARSCQVRGGSLPAVAAQRRSSEASRALSISGLHLATLPHLMSCRRL